MWRTVLTPRRNEARFADLDTVCRRGSGRCGAVIFDEQEYGAAVPGYYRFHPSPNS